MARNGETLRRGALMSRSEDALFTRGFALLGGVPVLRLQASLELQGEVLEPRGACKNKN